MAKNEQIIWQLFRSTRARLFRVCKKFFRVVGTALISIGPVLLPELMSFMGRLA